MLQYKIPQNIGVEDRIVGPFTLKQLIIVACGVGISYVLFAITSKLYELNTIEYFVIAIPALISIAAALLKINGLTFFQFLLLTLEYAIKPKKRAWDHRGIVNLIALDLKEEKKKDQSNQGDTKEKKNVNLDDLSRILDSGGGRGNTSSHQDIDNAKDDDLVTQAFFGNKKNDTENMYWRTKESHKNRLDMLDKLPRITPQKEEREKKEAAEKKTSENFTTHPISKDKPKIECESDRQLSSASQENAVETKTEKRIPIRQEGKTEEEKAQQKPNPIIIQKTTISEKKPEKEKDKENKDLSKPAEQRKPESFDPDEPKKKKKRRRKKKKSVSPSPVRENTQINSTVKKEPIKLVKQPTVNHQKKDEEIKKNPPSVIKNEPIEKVQEKKPSPKSPQGEFNLKELQKGEIEINLD